MKMGSNNPDSEAKQEMDDSGYVQEDGLKHSPKAAPSDEAPYNGTTQLLDLSDDALLYILRYCSPMDLKALGFTCTRLASLILDRTLWTRVDARSSPCGPRRVRWFLSHGVSANTTALLLSGYARDAKGCLGFIVGSNDKPDEGASGDGPSTSQSNGDVSENEDRGTNPSNEDDRIVSPRLFRLTSHSLPRYGHGTPYWPESQRPKKPSNLICRGPRVTMTHAAFKHLSNVCPKLEELALDNCIIDCATVNVGMFPKYLKKLSLRGSKCFNVEKSFLFRIQDHLTDLEELDLSYCEWVEPACLLPLSKLPKLETLYMRECPKLSEFVAYASLATRYGFKTLKVLDLRGCPVGDSEVSALGWLPYLERLYLSRAAPGAPRADHAHYTPPHTADTELDDWEVMEPEFFKNKESEVEGYNDEQHSRIKSIPNAPNGTNPNSYVFLERMVTEPVLPDEYSEVYQRYLSATARSPLATPDEYRQAYISYLTRNNRPYQAPTGYIIANPSNRRVYNVNPDENDNEPNVNEDRAQNDEAGPSSEKPEAKNDENENQAGTSKDDEPAAKKPKLDDSGPSNSSNENSSPSLPSYMRISSPNNRKLFDEYHISDDDSDDDDGPPQSKKARRNASTDTSNTSKNSENFENNDVEPSTSTCQNAETKSKKQRYIRFRQNQPPIAIEELQNNNNEESNNNNNSNSDDANEPGPSNERQEPKHRILVVNVGRRRHAMYQLSLPVCTVAEPVDLRTNNVHPLSRNVSSLIYASQLASRLDHGALVTDSAIQRFGRADGENISYVQIGPNGPVPAPFIVSNDRNARPDRSNLRRLSVTGFRHVTDASLNHLATAAPHLEFVDFTDTGVTRSGVEQFKSLRPDVEVIHSPFEKEEDPS